MLTKAQKERIAERFFSMVSKTPTKIGCRPWTGYIAPSGYGMFELSQGGDHQSELAHRVAYAIGSGDFSFLRFFGGKSCKRGQLVIRHAPHCPMKHCVEFTHLMVGTQKENIDDNKINGKLLRGEDVGTAVLTEDDVRDIRATAAAHPRSSTGRVKYGLVAALAQHFEIKKTTVSQIIDGQAWDHVAGFGNVIELKVWDRAGSRNAAAKLTEKKVQQIREAAARAPRVPYGKSTKLAPGVIAGLANQHEVSAQAIYKVLSRSNWSQETLQE